MKAACSFNRSASDCNVRAAMLPRVVAAIERANVLDQSLLQPPERALFIEVVAPGTAFSSCSRVKRCRPADEARPVSS